MMGIEFPIIAFTHCKDVAVAVINSGGFAVLGEAMHTADEISADIKWIRDRVDGKPFGIDLVLPASVAARRVRSSDLIAKIPAESATGSSPTTSRRSTTFPTPRASIDLHQWGGLNQEMARAQLDVLLDERVPVIASGLGQPGVHSRHRARARHQGLRSRRARPVRPSDSSRPAWTSSSPRATTPPATPGPWAPSPSSPEVASIAGDTPIIAGRRRHHRAVILAAALCLGASGGVDRHTLARLPGIRHRHDHQGAPARLQRRRHGPTPTASRA